MKKLFLLDAYALIYRAHFAFIKRPLINSKNLNVSAIQGFMNSLWDVISKEKPTHIAVAFDLSGPTFRTEMYTAYKANRQEQPEDITIAVPYIKAILRGMNIPILECQGYEADDVIGTIAGKAEKEGFQVFMMTPDKDYGQLVTENVFLFKPAAFGNDVETLGVPQILEKWGIVRIEQVIDMLGLQGDAVDNIPGVPGIGPKSAQALIAEYGSVENIIANASKLKGKQQELFVTYADQAILSKQLAAIDVNVPIEFNADACALTEFNNDELTEIFRDIEFRSLSTKILNYHKKTEEAVAPEKKAAAVSVSGQIDMFGTAETPVVDTHSAPQSIIADKNITNTPHTYHLVETAEQRADLLKTLLAAKAVSFDTETTGIDPNQAELVGMSFAVAPFEAWYVPVPVKWDDAKAIVAEFAPFFENESIVKVGQNIKYDYVVLGWYGVTVRGELADTMLAHYLLEPDKRHGMDYLSETYLGYEPVSIESLIGKGKKQLTMRDIAIERVKEYAAEDADVTLQLQDKLFPLLPEELRALYNDVEAPMIRVLADMEREGVRVDADFLNEYSVVLEKDIADLQASIYEQAGVQAVNLNAPGQVGEMLFDKLKLPYRFKKTKTGAYSTDEEILTELAYQYPIVNDILTMRSLNKLKSTYVDALPRLVNPRTGRIHSSFNQALAQTGRLSSQNPNVQNIPVRSERGREVRKAFVARDSEHLILSADYSQIELRLIAEIASETAMLDAFQKGLDIHAATASKVFNVPIESVTKEQRYQAKTVNFSIIYGAGAQNLSKQLNIKTAEAKVLIEAYFREYSELKQYMENIVQTARTHGYVTTLKGRRRYLRDINSANGMLRSNDERIAVNTPIQGSAADMIKIAMVNIREALIKGNFKTKLILQVHDELIFDVYKPELEQVKPLIEDAMKHALPNLRVPIEVGMGVGENWFEAH